MKKNVLITGASGNLGKATVEQFLKKEYNVIATSSSGKSLGFEGKVGFETTTVDLTNEIEVEKTIKQIFEERSIDAAILLVGAFANGNLSSTDGVSLKKMMTLNFETTYFVARPVFEKMINQENGGRIILIGSKPALNPVEAKDSVGYALAKSLLFRLAEILNAEGARKNVVTHVIVPSTIDTPSNRKATPDADFSGWVTPEEISETIAYLCSPEGKSICDSVIKVYGNS